MTPDQLDQAFAAAVARMFVAAQDMPDRRTDQDGQPWHPKFEAGILWDIAARQGGI